MKVYPLCANNSQLNMSYLLEIAPSDFICIDPFNAQNIVNFLKQRNATLSTIINTHEHWDHYEGNSQLVEHFSCQIWGHKSLREHIPHLDRELIDEEELFKKEKSYLRVMATPGHTHGHICLVYVEDKSPKAIFCGDTLFNAGVGNCKNGGNPEILFETIQNKIKPLPDETIIYSGHNYLQNNLGFALSVEKDNADALKLLELIKSKKAENDYKVLTLKDERKINPFLRLSEASIQKNLGLFNASEREVFLALRKKRDSY